MGANARSACWSGWCVGRSIGWGSVGRLGREPCLGFEAALGVHLDAVQDVHPSEALDVSQGTGRVVLPSSDAGQTGGVNKETEVFGSDAVVDGVGNE